MGVPFFLLASDQFWLVAFFLFLKATVKIRFYADFREGCQPGNRLDLRRQRHLNKNNYTSLLAKASNFTVCPGKHFTSSLSRQAPRQLHRRRSRPTPVGVPFFCLQAISFGWSLFFVSESDSKNPLLRGLWGGLSAGKPAGSAATAPP